MERRLTNQRARLAWAARAGGGRPEGAARLRGLRRPLPSGAARPAGPQLLPALPGWATLPMGSSGRGAGVGCPLLLSPGSSGPVA